MRNPLIINHNNGVRKFSQLFQIALLFIFVLSTNASFAQSLIITGSVKEQNNEPITGVNIVEVDANGRFVSGTTTDFNGNFSFKISSRDAKIQVSFIG
ncbi:MAG TPA: carboxypeptidase-like regulatory domain-containing protein, partial [Prolixibacteraceae bacterium]|nr:carboxypeptidase-like regulatory domain-containing protein [Prolixibacteraceae bacterium]